MRALALPFLLSACLAGSSCSNDTRPADAGLWPFPRMETLEALQKNHRALDALSREDPQQACIFARFCTAEWLLAVRDIPSGHRDALFSHFGIACPNAWRSPECAMRLFSAIGDAFARCRPANAELSEWGQRLVQWQRDLKPDWGPRHFAEAMALLDSPLARETRIALLGTFEHALGQLLQRQPGERSEAFVRWLGFPCPVWAASFTQAGPVDNPDDWPASCMLSCPQAGIAEPLADFVLRARKLAAACTPQTVGLQDPQDYRFYTLDNHLIFRTALFWRKLLADAQKDPHPLSWMHAAAIARAQEQWERLELPLYPAARFGDDSPIGFPDHSLAAVEPVSWPVVHIHALGAFLVEQEAVYHAASGKIDSAPPALSAAPSFADAVRRAASFPEPTLSFSGPVSSDQFLEAVEIFRQAGHARMRLLFRNSSQVMRACTLELDAAAPAEHDILLTFGPDELSMVSASGALASNPFRASGPYDFSGLRQKLEQIRRKTPQKAVVHLRLKGGMAFASIAKLLGYIKRNASGRQLLGAVRIMTNEK